jgi:hypothetical protein
MAVFMVNLAAVQTIVEAAGRGDSNKISDIQLKKGEAAVWYLYHCGWAVKTASTLMIFDYLVEKREPEPHSLSNGFVNPEEIKGQNVYVFISHGHGDHFDKRTSGNFFH